MKSSLESRIEDLYTGTDEEWGQALVSLLDSKPMANRSITIVISFGRVRVVSSKDN